MIRTKRTAAINRRVLTIVVLVVGLVGVGLVGGHYIRKRMIAQQALTAGRAALAEKNWKEATKQLRTYLSKYPQDEEVLLSFAEASLSVRPMRPGDLASATKAYRMYLRKHLGDREICDRLARMYFANGDYLETSYIAHQRLSVASSDTNAMIWQGRALMGLNKLSEANEALSRFVQDKNPHAVEIYGMLADISLHDQNSIEKALQWLSEGVKNNLDSAEAYAKRGKFYRAVKRDPIKAHADFEAADKLQSTDPKTRLLLAEEWLYLHELDRADAELQGIKPVTTRPDEFEFERQDMALSIFRISARVALRRGDREKMIDLANRGLAELEGSHRLVFVEDAAKLYLSSEKLEEARRCIEEYRNAMKQAEKPGQAVTERLAILDAALATAEGHPYEALQHLENVVALGQVQDDVVWRYIARAYMQTGQDRRAIAALEKYIDRGSDDRPAVLELARLYYRFGEWVDVQKYAQMAERLKSDDLEAALLRIEATLRLLGPKPDAARVEPISTELTRLRSLNPKRVQVRLLQALAADLLQQQTEVVKILEQASAECDNSLAAILQMLDYLKAHNQTDEAIKVCQKAIPQAPNVAVLPLALAELQRSAGKKDEARKTLELSAAKLPPEEAIKVNLAMARLLQSIEAKSDAIVLLRRLATERPKDLEVRLLLLDTPEVQDNEQEAQHLIDEIRTIEGERGLRWSYEQARLLLRNPAWKSRQQEILQLLTRCTEGDPGWSAPVLALGSVNESLGKDEQAEELYTRFVDKYPKNVTVTSRLLELLERQGRYLAATQIIDRLPQVSEQVNEHRAKLAIGRGDYETAMQDLKGRVAANPKDATSRVLLARLLYQQTKDMNSALKLLEEAQTIAPQLLSAISTRVSILHAEGKKNEALAVLNAEVDRRKDFFAYKLRADYYAASGQMDKAEEDFKFLTTFASSAADGYLKLGNFYENTARLDDAITKYEQGLKLEPAKAELQRALVRALISHTNPQNRERGLKMLEDMLKQAPEEPTLLALRAATLLREDKPESQAKALALLERVVELDPRNVTAQIHLVRHALDEGDLTKAGQLAARAIGANPDDVDLLVIRANIEKELNNKAAAKESARAALQRDAQNVPGRVLLAQLALETGDTSEAETLIKQAMDLSPQVTEIHLVEADILAAKHQEDVAIQKLEAFRQTEPGKRGPKVLLSLAELYRKRNDLDKAESLIAEAEKIAPDEFSVFIARLRLVNNRKQIEKVIGLLSDRMKRHPTETPALTAAATILANSNQPEQMEKIRPLFEEFLNQDPKNIDANLALAIMCYQMNDKVRAENAYRRILEVDPYQREAINNLAWIVSQDQAKYKEALDLANKGVLRYPEDPNLLNTRGVIYYNLRQYAEANLDFQKCLALNTVTLGTRVRTLIYLGRIAIHQGEKDKAKTLLAQALEIERKSQVLTNSERDELQKLVGAPATKPASG